MCLRLSYLFDRLACQGAEMKLSKAQKEKLLEERCAVWLSQKAHFDDVICNKCKAVMRRDRDICGDYFWCLCGKRHYPAIRTGTP